MAKQKKLYNCNLYASSIKGFPNSEILCDKKGIIYIGNSDAAYPVLANGKKIHIDDYREGFYGEKSLGKPVMYPFISKYDYDTFRGYDTFEEVEGLRQRVTDGLVDKDKRIRQLGQRVVTLENAVKCLEEKCKAVDELTEKVSLIENELELILKHINEEKSETAETSTEKS